MNVDKKRRVGIAHSKGWPPLVAAHRAVGPSHVRGRRASSSAAAEFIDDEQKRRRHAARHKKQDACAAVRDAATTDDRQAARPLACSSVVAVGSRGRCGGARSCGCRCGPLDDDAVCTARRRRPPPTTVTDDRRQPPTTAATHPLPCRLVRRPRRRLSTVDSQLKEKRTLSLLLIDGQQSAASIQLTLSSPSVDKNPRARCITIVTSSPSPTG